MSRFDNVNRSPIHGKGKLAMAGRRWASRAKLPWGADFSPQEPGEPAPCQFDGSRYSNWTLLRNEFRGLIEMSGGLQPSPQSGAQCGCTPGTDREFVIILDEPERPLTCILRSRATAEDGPSLSPGGGEGDRKAGDQDFRFRLPIAIFRGLWNLSHLINSMAAFVIPDARRYTESINSLHPHAPRA